MFSLGGFNFVSLIPVFIMVVLISSAFAAIYVKPDEFQKSRVFVFMTIMAGVAVFVLSINVILTTSNLETQKTINAAQFTKQSVDKLWLYPNQILTEKTQVRPEFYASLYYNNLNLYEQTQHMKTDITVAAELEEQYVAILLIQCMEDYLTMRKLDETGDEVWLVNFLQWAQSPYLKEHFDRLKYNFASGTIKFAELLFDYAKNIPVPTRECEVYKVLSDKLLKDQRLLNIYKGRAEIHSPS